MAYSKRHIDKNQHQLDFELPTLSKAIRERINEIVFAYILASGSLGKVRPYSDLDLAVYLAKNPNLLFYTELQQLCSQVVGPVRCDVGILNDADPVHCFEARKGHLFFSEIRRNG